MRKISEKGKQREGRGTGSGKDYKPYIQAREFGSLGTCANPIDWKTGRTVELLSQGEAAFWYISRWDDVVLDIQEQYPLDLNETLCIADTLGVKHPHDRETRMTSDFLVTYKNRTQRVFSLKSDRGVLEDERSLQKLLIEKLFWKHRGISFKLVFKSDLNMTLFRNIRFVVEYYDARFVHDDASLLKHLIATKQITPDMESAPLSMPVLTKCYEKQVEQWKKSH